MPLVHCLQQYTAANSAPTASNSTVYINENNQVSSAGDRTPSNITKVFATGDFNYSDADSDSLSKIQITTLESAGALEYSSDGSTWTDVTLNHGLMLHQSMLIHQMNILMHPHFLM